tara:strand:- start:18 stop:206 length:189 start_codon:yes stop_codon:yes gene_type:complete
MESKFIRKGLGILINKDESAYNARIIAKKNSQNQKSQEEEIEYLKAEIDELKEILNTLILDK